MTQTECERASFQTFAAQGTNWPSGINTSYCYDFRESAADFIARIGRERLIGLTGDGQSVTVWYWTQD